MAKYLVIVESPAKVKTIKKFLGSNYEVMASMGHVRDLPKSQIGVSPDNDFEPKYITIRGKGDLIAGLRKEAKKAEKIYLATDPDREGEAISWHLTYALKLEGKKVYRITFNEITKNAVKESLKHPREIDMDLVDAQQARRVLDRMVGYGISPVLWAKVKRGLSAGRVQSVALRLICEREDEIAAFIPEEYWTIDALLSAKGEKKPLTAHFTGNEEGKITIGSKEEKQKIVDSLQKETFEILDVKKGERSRKSPLPFTTSTLQQEAGKVLNFSTQKTMRIAQQLYEGIDVKGEGTIGIITYLRTDSIRIADEAIASAKEYITDNYGEAYARDDVPEQKAKSGKKIQDAHEAIRPTDIARTPASIKESLSRDQLRLYTLIWNRYVACRMNGPKYETTNVKIGAGSYRFSISASKCLFDGFLKVYTESDDKEKSDNVVLTDLKKGMKLTLKEIEDKQHFTQAPAHYTESSLVKALEEQGIGRPSTYAPTITTIITRRYVVKEDRNLFVTEMGEAVNKIMTDAFPSIVDVRFTANLEMLLDNVEEGEIAWKTIVRNFYPDLEEAVKKAEEDLAKVEIKDEVSDVKCDQCGRMMVIKYGPHGKFLACPGFPECRNTKPYLEKIGVPCPVCGRDIVIRKTKKGRKFYGCESGSDCTFMSWQRPVKGVKCEKCGSLMVRKGNKLMCMNEDCKHLQDMPAGDTAFTD
ncbi:MAG: type I DNA topoisomerase [Lachnospiraceae bacterium]|nr:type I DNA topoisomerase [Lachnospiraceae bacterium]